MDMAFSGLWHLGSQVDAIPTSCSGFVGEIAGEVLPPKVSIRTSGHRAF